MTLLPNFSIIWSRDTLRRNCVTRHARWLALQAAGLALIVLALGGCGVDHSSTLAIVDGHDLTTASWLSEMLRTQGAQQLVGMIDEDIIRQQAARAGLSASKEDVEARIQQAAAYLGSNQALKDRLAQLKMTQDQLRQRAEVAVLLDALAERSIKLGDADIKKYYNAHVKEFRHGARVKARMMLFNTKSNAEAVDAALKAGGDFAGLAKSLSQDPATAPDGGDMGWFQANRYAAVISKEAFSLQPGQTSPIFHGPDGWYIVKVEKKMPAGQDSLGQVHDRIEARMRQEELVPARDAWLKAARKQAHIDINDDDLAARVEALLATAPPEPILPGLMTPDRMMMQAHSNSAALGLGGG